MAKSQSDYNKEWESKNREKSNYIKARSSCRSFIKNKATKEDVVELRELLDTREKELNK